MCVSPFLSSFPSLTLILSGWHPCWIYADGRSTDDVITFPFAGSTLKSQNGKRVQPIGYGVGTAWFKTAGGTRDAALRAGVVAALDAGFRHIDEAEMYG